MKKRVTIIGLGKSVSVVALAISRELESTNSVIVIEDKMDEFTKEVVDGFLLGDQCKFDLPAIVKDPPPKYLFNGKLKRR
jgi:hypothetical protein